MDSRSVVRDGLIAWRDAALSAPSPPWDGITLLSHAIWWLAGEHAAGPSTPREESRASR